MKKKKKTTIFRQIMLPLLLVVVLQGIILYSIMAMKGVFSTLDENALSLLQERTNNKYQNLSGNMIKEWSALSSTETTITELIEKRLESENKDWSDIQTDPELNALIVEDSAQELMYRLRNNKTTGIFMILDGVCVEGDENSYSGIYIRDTDPTTDAADNSDLLLLRGLPKVSRMLGISLDSFWEAGFELDENDSNDSYYFNPYNEAKNNKIKKSQYAGYWHPVFRLKNDNDCTIITYSKPLLNADGDIYGVIGIEIRESYLSSILNDRQYNNEDEYFYYLGITEDEGKSYKKVASTDAVYDVVDFEVLSSEPFKDNTYITLDNYRNATDHLQGIVYPIQLYNNNTAFANEQWSLIGMEKSSVLFRSTKQFKQLLFGVIMITLLIGGAISVLASHKIVKPIQRMALQLRKSKNRLSVDLTPTGIEEIDSLADAIVVMNEDLATMTNRTSELIELSGIAVGVYEIKEHPARVYCSDAFFLVLELDIIQPGIQEMRSLLEQVRRNQIEEDVYEIEKGQDIKWVRLVVKKDNNREIGAIMDVTEEILEKRRIEKERDYDSLTGIWNRRAFENRIEELFRKKGRSLGVAAMIMFDLDNLKFLNDVYGHDCGDVYIKTFASVLEKYHSSTEYIARRSGDEFYVFIYGYHSKEELRDRIRTMWRHLTQESMVLPDGEQYKLRVSGGIAWYPQDSMEPNQLVHYADFAMYRAKHSQKGSVKEFDNEAYKTDAVYFNGHDALNRLIDKEKIRFVFQPIISAHTGEVFGHEMLMRSEIEEFKTPDIILRMAKSQGKLYYIERITWFKGLRTVRQLLEHQLLNRGEKIFINSIANQKITSKDEEEIVKLYNDILPDVVLEVTESEDNNMDYTNKKLQFVSSHGGLVAIDDFGTGYNSELALVQIASDIVKIDISFVRNVDADRDKQILIKNLIRFAKQRDIAVLAEGVETYEEMKTLIEFGVDYLQGYYLARPQNKPQKIDYNIKKQIINIQQKEIK